MLACWGLALYAAAAHAQLPPGPGEYGDAPEGAPAYPALGVAGAFPTCYGGPAGYIRHAGLVPIAWFGLGMDSEPDGNAGNCPTPPYELDECWGVLDGDGGLVNATTFTIFQGNVQQCSGGPVVPVAAPCATIPWGPTIDMLVTNQSGGPLLINVLFDWNQDGRWNGQSLCPGGGPVPEHAVVNLPVPDGYVGLLSGLSPGALLVGPNAGPVWARFTMGDPVPMPLDWDGAWDFDTGETEDYLLAIGPTSGAVELGDAPEDAPAYPGGAMGHFPTCITGSPIGFVLHQPPLTGWFGPTVDLEIEGNQDLCGFTAYDHDECDGADGDAGLLRPQPYTLANGSLASCGGPGGAALPGPCATVSWGADLDISIANGGGQDLYLNVLADWDRSGDWGQVVTCASGITGSEHVLANQIVPAGFSGPASLLGLLPFESLSAPGPVWFRFTLGDAPVPAGWTGEGSFGNGETEDYLLVVGWVSDVPLTPARDFGLRLLPALPNPFNPRTEIRCELDAAADLRVTIHDARGRLVRGLAAGVLEAGVHDFAWDGTDDRGRRVESGVYFVRADAGRGVRTQKVVLFK